jgi:hypothetical protein
MTDTPKGSDPAYPVPGHHYAKGEERREDFAKFALMGLLARCAGEPGMDRETIINAAVGLADALIAALDKPS